MSGFRDNGGFHALYRISRDPLYFGHWFKRLLSEYVSILSGDETASVLPDYRQWELVGGLMYLIDLDNSPISFDLIAADENADRAIVGYWYSVQFPWGSTREFYQAIDSHLIEPSGRGDMFTADGLRDLADCLDVWLNDSMRKPDFKSAIELGSELGSSLYSDGRCESLDRNVDHDGEPRIRSKDAIQKLGIGRSTFYEHVKLMQLTPPRRGVWQLSDIKKMALKYGFNAP